MGEEDLIEFNMGTRKTLRILPEDKVDLKAVYRALDEHEHVQFLPPKIYKLAPPDDVC